MCLGGTALSLMNERKGGWGWSGWGVSVKSVGDGEEVTPVMGQTKQVAFMHVSYRKYTILVFFF